MSFISQIILIFIYWNLTDSQSSKIKEINELANSNDLAQQDDTDVEEK